MSADTAFSQLANDLAEDGFVTGKMFGLSCLKFDGKAIVCLQEGGAAFKLGRDTAAHAAAMELDGAEIFDPTRKGRQMKDWVWVPADHAQTWAGHARAAASTS
ncbi:hypothetical protein GCM10009799_09200 [Nocardiopsis rhodophaea]|uniref:TfoX N-terminal domain-containing protein n=1 Tax=Nocardiopsis rhodophaea TaxID=280238 RepID=A0ABN2SG87_9ACTN